MPKCVDPVLCYDDGSTRKFRHFSLATPMFKALHNRVFSCGLCVFCRKRRASELALRCVLHASLSDRNCFLTLTYDEKREGYHNVFQYSDIQGFKKRLRAHVAYDRCRSTPLCSFGKAQLFNVHEYGKNTKKHWHLVCFNYDFVDKVLFTTSGGHRLYSSPTLDRLWPFGFSTIGDVTEASALYTAQYVQKDLKNGNTLNQFKSHSKHSGIGREYFLRHYDQILRLGYIPFNGRKAPVPRYFQKLAHKHWSHFYEPVNFEDTKERKALYRPFPPDTASRDIADLFVIYRTLKEDYLREITEAWEEEIFASLFSKEEKDFQKSGSNYLYDLSKRTLTSEF